MSDQIPLGLIGISHKTASVEIREKVALSEEEMGRFVFVKSLNDRDPVGL